MVEAVIGLELVGKLNWRGDSAVGDASLMRMLGRRTISGREDSGLLFSLLRFWLLALERDGLGWLLVLDKDGLDWLLVLERDGLEEWTSS
jgi:hypothetical protein